MSKPYLITNKSVAGSMNILLYGDPGVGKTVLIGTAQDSKEMAGVLVANVEGGLISLASRGDIQAVNIVTICHDKEYTYDEDNAETSLEQLFWDLANKDKKYKGIKTLGIDSVTELQTLNLEEIVDTSMKGNASRKDRDKLWIEDYGKSTVQLKRLFRMYRDLPLNVIWTALPKYKFEKGATENSAPQSCSPSLTDKLAGSLMGYVDFVWYMYATEETNEETKEDYIERHLLTQAQGGFQAKTRGMKFSEAIGKCVDNPNLAELYEQFQRAEEKK